MQCSGEPIFAASDPQSLLDFVRHAFGRASSEFVVRRIRFGRPTHER